MRKFIALSGLLCLTRVGCNGAELCRIGHDVWPTKPGGSARIQAMGGSQVALGGDYSSGLSNPAGLGMYNRSEFTITPGYSTLRTEASYLGNKDTGSKTNLYVPGLSLVIHTPYDKNGFVGGSFGISLTRTNDFNRSTFYHGKNDDSSIIDYFIDDANGATTDQFDNEKFNTPTGLGYFNYLIGPQSLDGSNLPDDEYTSDVKTFQRFNRRISKLRDHPVNGHSHTVRTTKTSYSLVQALV